jgi:peptidoglycan/LPS O-acetylase OafA/YrhL
MLATRVSGDAFRFSSLRARRFLPLHLTGVAIAFGTVALTWLAQHYNYEYAPDRPAFSIEPESAWGYLSSILLLQGFIGPQFAGYAAAWSLSIELWTNVLLVVAIAAVPWAHRKQWVGPAAMAFGALILVTADGTENAIGWTAFGRGLTGLGTGMVMYWAYTVGVRRGVGSSWPAIGATLGLIGLLGCMYESDDVRRLEYLPILVTAAGLIFCLVQPSDGPSHRLLNSEVGQWLGSRSFALYALHGPMMLVVSLFARLYGLHLHEPKVAIVIIIVTLIGALSAAEIGHRFIERLWLPKKSG